MKMSLVLDTPEMALWARSRQGIPPAEGWFIATTSDRSTRASRSPAA
jgi:hypothetical protein